MTWLETLPIFGIGFVLFFLPGFLVLVAGRVRGLALLALPMPVTFSIGGLSAAAFGLLGIPFNTISFSIASLVIAALVLVLRVALTRKLLAPTEVSLGHGQSFSGNGMGRGWTIAALVLALAGGGALIITNLLTNIASPEFFSQTFDNVFHLNAVKHIAVTEMGSSLTLGNLTEASQAFYPAAMHDMFSLLHAVTGASVPVAVNVGSILLAGVTWPLSVVYLVTRVTGARPVPILAAGLLSAGSSAFPYLLIGFGVLYPLFAGIAFLPVALALVIEILKLTRHSTHKAYVPGFWLVTILPGLALTHPSVLVAFLLFCIPMLVARGFSSLRAAIAARRITRALTLWCIGLAVYAIGFTAVWLKIRPDLTAAPWGAHQSTSQAIGEVVASAPNGAIAAWVLMIFTIIGVFFILRWRPRLWWLIAIYALAGILYMFASGWGTSPLRTFMVGVWYNDPFRLAALLPVATLPLAIIGVDATLRYLRLLFIRVSRQLTPARGHSPAAANWLRWLAGGLAFSTVLVLAFASQSGTLSAIERRISIIFALDEQSTLVNADEAELISRLSSHVPEDESIVLNPFTGASLAYALGDRRVIPPHMFGDRSDEEQYLIDHWSEAAYNPNVCPIVRELGAFWALDFGLETVIKTHDRYLGVIDLTVDQAPGVELIDQQGEARLFRLTSCE